MSQPTSISQWTTTSQQASAVQQTSASHDDRSDADRWQAVTRRRTGRTDFVYAVRTTGVYCLCGCASRRPRRENVEFFDDAGAAEHAGYRACRRCRPDLAKRAADDRLAAVAQHIERHADESLPLSLLAELSGLSPSHLQRRFTARYGLSPARFHAACRKQRLEQQLRTTTNVAQAICAAGYGSASRVYERSDELLGMTPRQYQQGGRGVEISWACLETQLGEVMLGATERGLCFLSLGDDARALHAELARRFPMARLVQTPAQNQQLDAWRQALDGYLGGLRRELPLPLDVHGTAFQTLVWQFLQAIPYGQTRSYSEVAAALGRPSAVRAVARACATNDVSLVIPCHRVLRSDGSLGGYRWGIERKQQLLELERRVSTAHPNDDPAHVSRQAPR